MQSVSDTFVAGKPTLILGDPPAAPTKDDATSVPAGSDAVDEVEERGDGQG